MTTETMHSESSSIAAPKDNLMEDLQMVVADAENLLRATANQAGRSAASTLARIQENLQVVKESMVAAEAVVIERNLQAETVTGYYIHDNVWSWR